MTLHVPEDVSGWLADWSLIIVMGDAVPPRDPNEDDDEDDDLDADDEH